MAHRGHAILLIRQELVVGPGPMGFIDIYVAIDQITVENFVLFIQI